MRQWWRTTTRVTRRPLCHRPVSLLEPMFIWSSHCGATTAIWSRGALSSPSHGGVFTRRCTRTSWLPCVRTLVTEPTVRFDELERASRQLLQRDVDSDEYRLELVHLIQQWCDWLSTHQRDNNALERVRDLYEAWKTSCTAAQGGRIVANLTNQPYVTLLATIYKHNGPAALGILQDWEHVLAGDLELAPRESHYQAVLHAYAMDPSPVGHVSDVTVTVNDGDEAPLVALEIVQHLEHSSWNLQHWPNHLTYQYAIHILSRVLVRQSRDEPVDAEDDHRTATHTATAHSMPLFWAQLQVCMDQYLQLVLQSRRTDEPYFGSLVVTLRDALRAWHAVDTWYRTTKSSHRTVPHAMDASVSSPLSSHSAPTLDALSMQRRAEWWTHWGHLIQRDNRDVWCRLTDEYQSDASEKGYIGMAVLEQTCLTILEMHATDLVTALVDATDQSDTESLLVAIASAEAMTQLVCQLSDMMSPKGMSHDATAATTNTSPIKPIGSFLPSGRHYQRAIQAWGHVKKFAVATRHEDYIVLAQQQQNMLLQRMQEQHVRNHTTHAQTTALEHGQATLSWNELLRAHLDAGWPGRVKELWDANASVPAGRIRRNSESFTVIFQALAAKRPLDSQADAKIRAQQAHSLLDKLVSHNRETRLFDPTADHFASVMVAWSRSYHFHAAPYCQQVFDRMTGSTDPTPMPPGDDASATQSEHTEPITPTSIHYRALITTWGFSRLPGAMQNVLGLFEHMKASDIVMDVKSYQAVLFALSRSQSVEGAREAERILNEMEAARQNNRRATRSTRNDDGSQRRDDRDRRRTFIDSYDVDESRPPAFRETKRSREYNHYDEIDASDGLEPTLACYNSVMYAWCYSGARDAPARCESVFHRLMTAYEKSEWDPALRPDSTSFVTLIDSMVHQSTATSSESTTQLTALATRAEEILAQMEAQAAQGLADVPDAKIYTAVMKAHWKSGAPEAAVRVEEILRRMKESYEAGNAAAQPDAHSMTVLLQTWAKSDAPNKASIAWQIHKEMVTAYENGNVDMKPNAYSVSAVLNACAYTQSHDPHTKAEAVKVALMALNELDQTSNGSSTNNNDSMNQTSGLNEFTFRHMFQVIGHQIDDIKERTRFAGVIFQRCCQAGYVSRWTLQSLKTHVPSLYRKLPVRPDDQTKLLLPDQWTRHVAKQDRPDPSWSTSR